MRRGDLSADNRRGLERQRQQNAADHAELYQLRHELEHVLRLRRRRRASAAEGDGHSHHVLVRQHPVQVQPGPEELGRKRAAVRGRHEFPVAKLLLPDGRRVPAKAQGARCQGEIDEQPVIDASLCGDRHKTILDS